MGIPLRIAEPTGKCQRSLRRFSFSSKVKCSKTDWGCDASVVIDVVDEADADSVHGDRWPHSDPRWPTQCSKCWGLFTDDDEWQRNDCLIYRLPDGTEFVMWGSFYKKVPAGTMIRIPWADGHFVRSRQFALGELAESWLVVLPDKTQWITTQSATGGGYWTVTGTPPNITVSPSIFSHPPEGWHGFIRNGELVPA